jgi:hypothetical protein
MARFGSSRCKANRRPDCGEPIPLDQRGHRKGFVEFARQLLCRRGIACMGYGECLHHPYITAWIQLHCGIGIGIGTRLLPVTHVRLEECFFCLIFSPSMYYRHAADPARD